MLAVKKSVFFDREQYQSDALNLGLQLGSDK